VATFDRRIVRPSTLRFLQACHARAPFHLAGGAALAGVHLRHRLSRDADLFFHDRRTHRDAVALLEEVALDAGVTIRVVRDAGTLVRAVLTGDDGEVDIDLVFDAVADVGGPESVEGVQVESLADLRANKLTCVLSRSEPRDLVDLLFLDRAGYPPEADLTLALAKDGSIDPGVLAWLLGQFPVEPLPQMLEPLSSEELKAFRDVLAERMRRLAVPDSQD
jgi:Nucleotidyl transferase AbiEii toxin, Type IV TA system